ncbi:MAG TPA: hypothetical protein VGL62_16745, partial [Vicinamibacterales bacterium]
FQTAGDQLTLLVTVVAPAKAPVTDLTAKDFKVQDGKQYVDVAAAKHATAPLSIVVVVENTRPAMGAAPRTRELRTSLRSFVDVIRAGSADAKIGLFSDSPASVPLVDLNASPADLDDVISQLTPSQAAGALVEAVGEAAKVLSEVTAPRRAIVTMDLSAPDPTAPTVLHSIESTVFQSHAMLWCVSVSGSVPETPSRSVILDYLTSATGGERKMIVGASGLENQMKAIANSLLSQYTLQIAQLPSDLKSLKIETPKGKALVAGIVRLQ